VKKLNLSLRYGRREYQKWTEQESMIHTSRERNLPKLSPQDLEGGGQREDLKTHHEPNLVISPTTSARIAR